MATTTRPTPNASARLRPMPWASNQAVSRWPSVAPEKAPDSTPTRVMPICTDERNLPGSSASRMAISAPDLPLAAKSFSRAGREETTANSDIDRKPLRNARAMTMRISKNKAIDIPAAPHSASGRFGRGLIGSLRRTRRANSNSVETTAREISALSSSATKGSCPTAARAGSACRACRRPRACRW